MDAGAEVGNRSFLRRLPPLDSAAWEEQVWFGQNKFLRVPGNAVGTGGDLSLQGLTVDVRFDF